MKTLFCIADVHSFYDEMMKALNEAEFDLNNENHILVHCGDLLDRGPKALDCLKFINSIPDNRKILIRGNHEDLLEEVFNRGYFGSHDLHNMTTDTVEQLSGIPIKDMLNHELTLFAALDKVKNHPEWIKYSKCLRDFYEIDSYVFVHGWIPIVYDNEDWRTGNWSEARWQNGMKLWGYSNYRLKDKTIVCGHYHTSWGHSRLHNYGSEFDDFGDPAYFGPFVDDKIIALDGCTAYSNIVNCYKIDIKDN